MARANISLSKNIKNLRLVVNIVEMLNIFSKQEPSMKVTGSMERDTDKVSKPGQMAPSTVANGKSTKPRAKVSSTMLMVTSTRVNGTMIKLTVMVSTSTRMARSTKATGKTISNTALVLRHGKMAPDMRAITPMAESMDLAAINGMTVQYIPVPGMKIRFMA